VLHQLNVPVVVLEAGDRPAGSWPRYYDSLRLSRRHLAAWVRDAPDAVGVSTFETAPLTLVN
jgi:cation diffusion facilitator CzcD-associated flavoprotein CzcO